MPFKDIATSDSILMRQVSHMGYVMAQGYVRVCIIMMT
jgi:hypothetical protein